MIEIWVAPSAGATADMVARAGICATYRARAYPNLVSLDEILPHLLDCVRKISARD